jgi:hypothetical protein
LRITKEEKLRIELFVAQTVHSVSARRSLQMSQKEYPHFFPVYFCRVKEMPDQEIKQSQIGKQKFAKPGSFM